METATTDPQVRMGPMDRGTEADDRVAPESAYGTFLRRVSEAVGAAIIFAIMVIFVIQVTARYFFNHPLPWTDEASQLLFPWLVFWGCCFMVPLSQQVRLDIVYNAMSRPVRRAFLLMSSLMICVVFVWALPKTWDYIDYMWRHRTPMLEIRYFWVFLCYAMFMVVMVARSLWAGWLVLANDDRAENV